MIVIAPVACGECGETVYVKAEDAVAIADDKERLDCSTHS